LTARVRKVENDGTVTLKFSEKIAIPTLSYDEIKTEGHINI